MISKENTPFNKALDHEMTWLNEVIHYRLKLWSEQNKSTPTIPAPPSVTGYNPFHELLQQHPFQKEERLLLALALAPFLRPDILEPLSMKDSRTDHVPAIFGGYRVGNGGLFLPTGDTFLFLAAGVNLVERMDLYALFDAEHWLSKSGIFEMDEPVLGETPWSLPLTISRETQDLCLYGRTSVPRYSASFPARIIDTKYTWEDLCVSSKTLRQLREIEMWVRHREQLMEGWNMKRLLQPGFRALFYGPPGTGKSLTGALLGKATGKMVFRIDLSQLVSKYIGETEKNLSRVFDRAENKDWILFFDEADALFGKRTAVKDSHDRYANQGVSYLLQRIEHFNGLAILATNLKDNIDTAFMRRMQAVVHFPMPGSVERKKLWGNSFPKKAALSPQLSLDRLSETYELSGGSITNVAHYCSLMALERGDETIVPEDVLEGLKREYQKLGRVLS